MKNKRLLTGLAILLGFISQSVHSDPRLNDIHYGVVHAVFTDELRFVINDQSINYTSASQITDMKGKTLLKKTDSFLGKHVKYHYYRPTHDSAPFLINLIVISDDEYNQALGARYGF